MSKTLIYLIAIFALWLYFRYGNFEGDTLKEADKADSGRGGTLATYENVNGFSGSAGRF